MSFNTTISSVKEFLVSNHMLVDEEWITGCVEYLSENNSNTEVEIKNLAKEQWLLNDLKEICPGSLPKNLKNQHKITLNGRFVLQINAVVDIGTPAYQQYLKLQKVNTENIDATTKFDEKVPNHRMIKLYMTDGVQDVTGIEYKPMRNLSCDITPGCKVLIKGPVKCRRGMMMLTESSVELLGGEVQEIAVSNSLAGLLSAKLGLPITQEPNLNTTTTRKNTDIPSPHRRVPPPHEATIDHTTRPVARVKSIQHVHNDEDDFDLDQLAAIEAQFSQTPLSNVSTWSQSNDIQKMIQHSDNSTILHDSGELQSITDKPCKRLSDNGGSQPEKKIKLNNVDDYPDDNELFENEEYLRELDINLDRGEREVLQNYPVGITTDPFVYIRQLNEINVADKAGKVFKIKGQIMKLLSKLSVGKEGWSLKCTLVDGTGAIDVEFTSDVLSNLVGITPQEMTAIKKEITKKPELKEKTVAALQKAKDTLQVLYCIIELTFFDVPKITRLIPFENSHVHLLNERQYAC